jgi:hypothetical protein
MRIHIAGVLLLMALTACGRADGTSATTVSAQESGKQYRAICTEKASHGGNEYVLSRWLDTRDKALALGEYHSNFKEKGHRVRYEERIRSQQTTP